MANKMFAKKMHRLVKKMQDKPLDNLDPLELLTEMARKKGENLSFPLEVETENQWNSLLKKEGLIVVDVYSGWSGPCNSMFSILRKLKLDTNDDRMVFAAANADNITQLAPFRNQSEPCYLFLGGGKPVKVLRGSNAPKLLRTIKSEFQHELDCIEGKEKRTLISIKFEATRRETSVKDAIALNELIALEEEEKREKLKPKKSPTPEPREEEENQEENANDDTAGDFGNIGVSEEGDEKEGNDEETGEKEEKQDELDEAELERRALMAESNDRLKAAIRPYTVIAIQSYLLETGAVTEIKDHLAEDFKLVRERYINFGDDDARKLFSIPAEIVDPDPPISAMGSHYDPDDLPSEAVDGESTTEVLGDHADSRHTSTAPTPIPGGHGGYDVSENDDSVRRIESGSAEEDGDEEDEEGRKSRKREKTPVVRMIPVPVPEVIIGDTLILLLECTRVKPLTASMEDKENDLEESHDADYYMIARTGPEDYEEAIEKYPESLHAMYGKEKYVAGVWCPRTYEDKRFVLLNYFPQFAADALMTPIPAAPKYTIFVYSALFSSDILEHPQFLKAKADVIASMRTRIKFEVAEKMLIASKREGDMQRALKWALTGQETLVISANGVNEELTHSLEGFDPIFSTKAVLEAGYFTGKLFPDVEVLLDEEPFPKQPDMDPLNLASFVEKVTEDKRKLDKEKGGNGKEVDRQNNNA